MQATKTKLLAIAAALIVITSFLMAAFSANQLNTARPITPIRVACVGDSITQGTEYPADLQMLLGANYSVGNFGAGGSTVSLESAKPYIHRIAFHLTKVFHANIIIIMLGTNDADPRNYQYIQDFIADYKTLIALLMSQYQTFKEPKIWLVKPPPIYNDSLGPNSLNLVKGVIPRIQQVAYELGLSTVDVYTPLLNHPNYFWDGVHPNSTGAEIIATQIYKAVTLTMAPP